MRFLTLFLLTSSAALASEGGEHAPETLSDASFPLLAHGVNLLILLVIIGWLAGPAIRDALSNRAASTRKDLKEAAAEKQAAQARYEELEARLSDFEQELAQLRAEAEKSVEREVASVHERAERDARLIWESATRSIRDEVDRARQALRRDAVDLAVELASDQVKQQIGANDEERLGREFLGAVQAQSSEVGRG